MANTIRLKRKIGSTQSAPGGANNAGEVAIWKAGTAPTDKLAMYFNDGVQWVSIIDQVANQVFPVAGAGTAGRVPTADAAGAISWNLPASVTVRGVTAGVDQGSVQATFNNDAITVVDGEVLIYTYKGSAYVYTGGIGAPVTGATANDFTVLGAAVNVDSQIVDLGTTAADIGAGWTALGAKPTTTGAKVTFATFKGETYVLTDEANPGTTASWTKLASGAVPIAGTGVAGRYPVADATGAVTWSALPYATSNEIKTGTDTTKLIVPSTLAGTAAATSAGATDAGKYVRLNATGKVDATMIDVQGLHYAGTLDVTVAYSVPSPAPKDGDFYTIAKTGSVHASWNTHMNTPPPNVTAGDLAFFSNNVYYLVESAQDVSSLVHKSGANAILADMSMTWTAPTGANTVIIDGADNTKSTIQNITLDSSVIDGGTYT